MNTFASHNDKPQKELTREKVPLSGAKLDVAIKAMESPEFLARLTMRITKQAAEWGFFNPFYDSNVDLPGGKSAADLAVDIIEKALDGSFTWDEIKQPDFYWFCCSRAESILSNWLEKTKRTQTMSPLIEEDENGEPEINPVNIATDGIDLYEVLRSRDGGNLGNRFLEDFALSLPDNSQEQAILMAIHDDRECVKRAYCRGKLSLSAPDYDAAMKRIKRAGTEFFKNWCNENNVKGEDRKELR